MAAPPSGGLSWQPHLLVHSTETAPSSDSPARQCGRELKTPGPKCVQEAPGPFSQGEHGQGIVQAGWLWAGRLSF